jgi:hypothetical protein
MAKTQTFAQRVKSDTLTNAAMRHMMAIRAENIAHPEVKRVWNAIPAAYKTEQQWDDTLCKYVGDNQHIYVDASQHSSVVTIGIAINDLENLGLCDCEDDCADAPLDEIASNPKTDKRLARLLRVYLTPEWEALPRRDIADNEAFRGRIWEFTKYVPVTTKETHPSVRWLRKADRVWDLDDHMKKPMKIRIFISGYVKSDNKTCRIETVEVREETVRTEVKRLVCA